ncbi:MAG: hypothetical protein B7W98_01850, partial [Parcubacteria group bacterium 20-58-5]
MKKIFAVVFLGFITLLLNGCDSDKSSDAIQQQQQESINKQLDMAIGMPSVVNGQEKRVLKDIIEMRDKQIVTITYTQDMNGKLHKMCDSIGYGISAAVQYTNPQRVVYSVVKGTAVTIPQADPNGLFNPGSTEGTWVMCKSPESSKVAPVYVEP